ncbi:MAG TPA: alpha/beta hydrolase [Rhodocyclaceae bacterium]
MKDDVKFQQLPRKSRPQPGKTLARRRFRLGGIEVIAAGPPDGGTPILFVHGAFAGAWMWDEVFLPYFAAAGYEAWGLSLRGHGESEGREIIDHHSIRDYVDDVMTVADAMPAPPVLVGHSMGGFVVQKTLEHRPAPAAVLMASVPPQGLVAASFHLAFSHPDLFAQVNRLLAGADISAEAVADALFAKPLPPELMRRALRQMSPESQRAIWDMSMFNLVSMHAVHRTPLMVLGAEEDRLVPAFVVQSTARAYGVPDHLFTGHGHGFPLEPGGERIADAVLAWLAKVELA